MERIFLYPAAALVMAAVLLAPAPAAADQIDGKWCHADGRSLTIEGPEIVTPGGTKMEGDYDRHGFVYSVPAGEPGTGTRVVMQQLDDDTMILRQGEKGAEQTWNPCAPPIS